MTSFYLYLAALTVTLNISVPVPTPSHPKQYGIAQCTGVWISNNEILTAGHCVSESRGHQWIRAYDSKSYAVDIEHLDKLHDLALLKVKTPVNYKYAKFGKPIDKLETVYTVNSGNGYINTFNTGMVNNLIIEEENDNLSIIHTATILHGASGSGLFNSKKELIGLNVAIIGGFSEATDITEIQKFLKCSK